MKVYTLRVPDDLAEKLADKAVEMNFVKGTPSPEGQKTSYGMNKFLCYILHDFCTNGGFAGRQAASPAVVKLEELLQKQSDFQTKLEYLIQEAAKHPAVEQEASKAESVLKLISRNNPMKFLEIQQITRINENELLVLLGHLYAEHKVLIDDKWRYSKI
jgi:hypothetical protein